MNGKVDEILYSVVGGDGADVVLCAHGFNAFLSGLVHYSAFVQPMGQRH